MALKALLASLLRRPDSTPAAQPLSDEHPYLSERYRFERLFGDLVRSRYTWQLTALVTLVVNAVLAAGFVILASQHKVVPYIIEVDELGQAHAIGQLQAAAAPDRAVQAVLLRFIHDTRTVPRDVHLLNVALERATAHVAGTAAETFTTQMRAGNEEMTRMLRVGDARYVSAITHILALPDETSTYRVTWQEKVVDARGGEVRKGYEGHFHMQTLPPPTGGDLLHNPMGIYVTSYALAETASLPSEGS